MELSILVAAGAGWLGWCYWRRCLRIKRREADREYWDRVRRECPTCGMNRRARADRSIDLIGVGNAD